MANRVLIGERNNQEGIYPKFDLLLVVKKLLEESPKFRFVPPAYICPVLTLLLSNIRF